MPTTTPCIALPYPVPSDPPDVAGDLQRLATAIDTFLCQFNSKQVGELYHFYDTGKGLPPDALLCDGSTFNTATYPALANHLGGNQVPDLRGRFLMMSSASFPLLSKGGFTDAILIEHTHSGAPHTHAMTHGHTASASVSGSVGARDINHRHRYDHGHGDAWTDGAGNHQHRAIDGVDYIYAQFGQGNLGFYNSASAFGRPGNLAAPWTSTIGDHQHISHVPSTGAIWSDWMWEGNPHDHAWSGSASVSVVNFTGSTGGPAFTGQTSGASGGPLASGAGRNMPPYCAVAILIHAR